MEYVSGVSLRDLIDQSPGGLGPQKAAFFLREIGKGLAFLHGCGIVHRDLKPSNIFYENGYVKVGDYGLAKSITTAASSQTITVGTVHYMAPEVGQGRYDASIDIYALGVILYEMITGQVQFLGSSPAEVLMRHMMDQPKLEGIQEPFAKAISRSLAKDPAARYKTVQEMVEEVFGPEHIRNSVSQFRPEELSALAALVTAKADLAHQQAATRSAQPAQQQLSGGSGMADTGQRIGRKIGALADRIAQRLAGAKSDLRTQGSGGTDQNQRYLLGLVVMAVIALAAGLLHTGRPGSGMWQGAILFVMMGGIVLGIVWAKTRLLGALEPGPFANALAGCVGICISALIAVVTGSGGTILPLFVLVFVDWRRLTSACRPRQIDWSTVIWASAIGGVIAAIHSYLIPGIALIAGAIIATQLMSPFGHDSHSDGGDAVNQGMVLQDNKGPDGGKTEKRSSAPQAAPGPVASPRSRLAALLLAVLPFPAGLHRIYVGKIVTGIIWLLTVGVCFVGQFVDLILIIAGRFTDKEKRPLLRWSRPKTQDELPVKADVTGRRRFSILAGILAFIAYIVLLISVLCIAPCRIDL